MIDHLSLRVRDMKKAATFYAEALAPLGYEKLMEFPEVIGLGSGGKPDLWLSEVGAVTPMHLAFVAETRFAVDAFYDAAIAAGGRDYGAPGLRPEYHPSYYGAF